MDKNIIIRPFLEIDFEVLFSIRNDFETQNLLLAHPRPNTRQNFYKWIENKTNSESSIFFVISNTVNETIGFVQANNINFIDRHCTIGCAIDPIWQKHGVFKTAMLQLEEFMYTKFSTKKFIGELLSNNHASLKACTSIGYNIIGEYKNHFYYNGKFNDVTIIEKHYTSDNE